MIHADCGGIPQITGKSECSALWALSNLIVFVNYASSSMQITISLLCEWVSLERTLYLQIKQVQHGGCWLNDLLHVFCWHHNWRLLCLLLIWCRDRVPCRALLFRTASVRTENEQMDGWINSGDNANRLREADQLRPLRNSGLCWKNKHWGTGRPFREQATDISHPSQQQLKCRPPASNCDLNPRQEQRRQLSLWLRGRLQELHETWKF